MSLFSLLDYGAMRYPGDPAVFEGMRAMCDWRSLRERALRLGAGIRSLVAEGDRVAIASANCPEYVEIMFAAWGAGLVVVPVNAKLHALEMEEIIADSGAAAIFASPELSAALAGLKWAGCKRCQIIIIGGEEYRRLIGAPPLPPQEVSQEALAWLFYTSGTTGRSKGAMLSHRNLMSMTIAHLADFEDLQHGDAILHAAPMSHGSGLYILPYVARAASQIIPKAGSFNPGDFLDLCSAHGRVGAFFAPTMLRRLRLELERTGRRAEGLRSVIYGGGPMYVEELKKCFTAFGPILTQLYGQGEAPMTITGLRRGEHELGDETILRSVGWPRSGVELAILDEAGRALSAGEIGEVACRGDVVMSGYWNNPAATAAALRHGWLLTGDRGHIDADGKLTLEGRSKELIISGGANIYPREVEEALLSCCGVAEAAVAGQPDPEWGEIVVAFIVQESACSLDASALDEHCRKRIARFKHPRRYVFVDALPKNNYGKIVKRDLAQLLAGGAPAPNR